MEVISFLNNKGGVGKSASVKTIAHMMAAVHKKRVLIVDMDPQGNTSSLYSSVDWTDLFRSVLYRTSRNKAFSVQDLLLDRNLDPHVCVSHTDYEGLDIIPAFLTLSEVEEQMKSNVAVPQQFLLRNQLSKLEDEYDFCLLDCSPSISLLNINALAASDEVYIPTRVDGDSLVGLAISINLIKTVSEYNPKLRVGGCFFTQYQARKSVSVVAKELLMQELPPNYLLPITIGVTKYIEESTYQQLPLLMVDKGKNKQKATQDYLLLTEYIVANDKSAVLDKIGKE